MFKAVFDTNILVSAILFGGPPRRCLQLVIEGKIELFTSGEIITEFEGVLRREKLGVAEENLRFILSAIDSIVTYVNPDGEFDIIEKDPADNKFIECAVEANTDFIISGDKHLLELGKFRKAEIIQPADFIKQYFQK